MQRLEGCLGDLPDQLRLVLELSTGVDASRALSPAAVADYLNVSVGRISQLEKRGLRQLRLTARAHGCGSGTQVIAGLFAFSSFEAPFGTDVGAVGGVAAARYTSSPSRSPSGLPARQAPPSGASLLGISGPPAAGEIFLVIFMAIAGALLLGFLFGDQLGLGPRYRQWRSRWIRRPPGS